jgi:UDP-N-acetylmuramate dehydrogenase
MIIDFAKLSSIKIGSKIGVKIVDEVNYNDEIIIGRATNSLVCSGNIGVLNDKYDFIQIEKGILKVGAKTKNSKLYNFTRQNNIKGFEFLSKLPGSVGGSVKMNAGMKNYEISQNLIAINGKEKDNFKFEYRYSQINIPIFELWFKIEYGFDKNLVKLFTQMRNNQPKNPSLGSAFKNPKNDFAGRLIEEVGLKGVKFGGVGFSEIHSNFLVNYGDGKCDDVLRALNIAKKRVFEKFGINLEKEIKIYS